LDPAGDDEVAQIDAVIAVHVGDEQQVHVRDAPAGLHQAPHGARAAVHQDALVRNLDQLAGAGAAWIGNGRACAE